MANKTNSKIQKDVDHKIEPDSDKIQTLELDLSEVNDFVQHRNELAIQKQNMLQGGKL